MNENQQCRRTWGWGGVGDRTSLTVSFLKGDAWTCGGPQSTNCSAANMATEGSSGKSNCGDHKYGFGPWLTPDVAAGSDGDGAGWLGALSGRTVLVVSSFRRSFEAQLAKGRTSGRHDLMPHLRCSHGLTVAR